MKHKSRRIVVHTVTAVSLGLAGFAATMIISPVIAPVAVAQAAIETETFGIENMTCALCPLTVMKAMEGVNGVRSVEVDFKAKTATVIFDPVVTTPEAVAAASTNAGYPAKPKG